MTEIQPARIRWNEDQPPLAEDFDDGYFSRHNGWAETEHVFIRGNRLRERWATLTTSSFVIGETGFGSGLNFVAAWRAWQQTAPAGAHLYFVSAELHPLLPEDLIRAAAQWPDLQKEYSSLVGQYPSLTAGFHVLNFPSVTLLLLLGDAHEMFSQLLHTTHPDFLPRNALVDAWFLDGFAPAKNPGLWTQELFTVLALLSKPSATLATFSAAGEMRRRLTAAGFSVRKEQGYAHKRDMVCAHFENTPSENASPPPFLPRTPWHLSDAVDTPTNRKVTIIGAGIAGCTLAYTLAHKGFQVDLIDAQAGPAQEASGNRQAMLYGKFSAQEDAFAHFNLASYLFALRFYQQLKQQQPDLPIQFCGLLQMAWCEKEKTTQASLHPFFARHPEIGRAVDAAEASRLADIPLQQEGLYFAQGGWMYPASVCAYLLQHPQIQTHFATRISALNFADGQWHLLDDREQTLHRATQVVLACGHQLSQFEQSQDLPLKRIRGQVSHVDPSPLSRRLKTVISGNGYIAPAEGDLQSLGATYTPQNFDLAVRTEEHQVNLDQLKHHAEVLSQEWQSPAVNGGRAHFRAASPDYFPLCGPLPEQDVFPLRYAALRKNAHQLISEVGAYHPGLYACAGLGSRGMTYAPLCAEVLASYLAQSPAPAPREVMLALHPARFAIRNLVKNRP